VMRHDHRQPVQIVERQLALARRDHGQRTIATTLSAAAQAQGSSACSSADARLALGDLSACHRQLP
jgi:hypothetical protein